MAVSWALEASQQGGSFQVSFSLCPAHQVLPFQLLSSCGGQLRATAGAYVSSASSAANSFSNLPADKAHFPFLW